MTGLNNIYYSCNKLSQTKANDWGPGGGGRAAQGGLRPIKKIITPTIN